MWAAPRLHAKQRRGWSGHQAVICWNLLGVKVQADLTALAAQACSSLSLTMADCSCGVSPPAWELPRRAFSSRSRARALSLSSTGGAFLAAPPRPSSWLLRPGLEMLAADESPGTAGAAALRVLAGSASKASKQILRLS